MAVAVGAAGEGAGSGAAGPHSNSLVQMYCTVYILYELPLWQKEAHFISIQVDEA